MLGFPKILGGISFSKAGKLYEGRKPIFFDKTGFLPSCSPLSQKNDQRACRPLDSGSEFGLVAGVFCSRVWTRYWKRLWRAFLLVACVTGIDVRHGCASVPCLDYVTGVDVKYGFQLAVFRLCV